MTTSTKMTGTQIEHSFQLMMERKRIETMIATFELVPNLKIEVDLVLLGETRSDGETRHEGLTMIREDFDPVMLDHEATRSMIMVLKHQLDRIESELAVMGVDFEC